MVDTESRLFSQGNSGTGLAVEQRLRALLDLGLLQAETVPVFDAATQTTADFLEVPICILGFLDQSRHWFKSAVGLSRLGLMNQLASKQELPRHESFCTHVVENNQVLAIGDTLSDPTFAKSTLVQRYGIRAYLGVPLMDSSGHCLGAIAVMDLKPRNFTIKDIKFLELMARWSMSELERNRLLGAVTPNSTYPVAALQPISTSLTEVRMAATSSNNHYPLFSIQVKLELLAQLTQELRTPLTSVLGMASVVSRGIYGPLTNKQKEYLEIIQDSGRYLLSMVNEISELGSQDDSTHALNPTSVDIEMLCQQVLNTLAEAAKRREQQLSLSLEPGRSRIWVLDKDKVRHLVYHLLFSVIQTATNGSTVHIHISHKGDGLKLAVSVSHPWLEVGLTQIDPYFCQSSVSVVANYPEIADAPYPLGGDSPLYFQQSELPPLPILFAEPFEPSSSSDALAAASNSELSQPNNFNRSRESLRLLLSCHLAELHNGKISVQGTAESGYRYVVSLPELAAVKGD